MHHRSSTRTAVEFGHFHAVRFYRDAESLSRLVGEFLTEGFREDQPAVVIATPAHRAGIVQHLNALAFDIRRLERRGDLILLDAEETLARFMDDRMPNAERFTATITPVLERAARGRDHTIIRAYGEMVDVLWKAGQTVAATRLEMQWNELARSHAFSLLCGYAMGNFYKDAAVEDICSYHTHVMSSGGEAALVS
jgi:MEDS: MEthanogen/methylotroph, DcmR Sensory domain